MDNLPPNQGTRVGTLGGLLFVLVGISSGEIVKTAVLAGVGALVSYSVSVAVRWMTGLLRKKFGK